MWSGVKFECICSRFYYYLLPLIRMRPHFSILEQIRCRIGSQRPKFMIISWKQRKYESKFENLKHLILLIDELNTCLKSSKINAMRLLPEIQEVWGITKKLIKLLKVTGPKQKIGTCRRRGKKYKTGGVRWPRPRLRRETRSVTAIRRVWELQTYNNTDRVPEKN